MHEFASNQSFYGIRLLGTVRVIVMMVMSTLELTFCTVVPARFPKHVLFLTTERCFFVIRLIKIGLSEVFLRN